MAKAKSVAAGAAVAAVAAVLATSEVVHEFVLYRREGVDKIPVMSDHDLDVVKQAKVNAVADALRNGQARPDLGITDRKVTYPLSYGKDGKPVRQAMGSTCEETEL